MKKLGGKKIALAVLAVVGAASAGMAASQGKYMTKAKLLTKEEAADLRTKLGACLVKNSGQTVTKLLANSDSLGTDYNGMGVKPEAFMFSFRLDLCQKYNNPQIAAAVWVKPGALRRLLMEQTYVAKFQTAPKPLLNEKGEPALAPARHFASKGDILAQAVAYAQLADCTAANGPDLADAVVRTGAGLPEERAAAIALAPVIGQCIPAGQDIALTPDTIRAIAAEGLWQRYAAAATPAQASAK